MVTTIYADTTPLLEAIAASDTERMISETLELLGPRKAPPAKIAGRVGLAALWGDADPHALGVLATVGRVSQWINAIPIGPEPGEDERRKLAAALPLAQAFAAVAGAVARGMGETHPALPEAIPPAQVKSADGVLGGMREAFAAKNVDAIRGMLQGYFATGADYRSFETAIYATLAFRYPEDGHPLIYAMTGNHILDMASWGGHEEPLIYWYPPLMVQGGPNTPAAEAARAYAAAPEHDLSWLRKRLAIAREEAAGPAFQQALFAGDAHAACEAVLTALRSGATPAGVAAGIELATAERINAVAEGDQDDLLRMVHVLLYVHAVRLAMKHSQDPVVWPLLYTAAAVVNSTGPATGRALTSAPAGGSLVAGGLIASSMLRSLEQQVGQGEAAGALGTARRYAQMGHPTEAIAGILGGVAAMHDPTASHPAAQHALPAVTAACEAYLMLPLALANNGQNALLGAAIRLAADLRGPHDLAGRIRSAIDARVR